MADTPAASYDQMYLHRTMIRDAFRTNAFKEALKQAVKPGDVVLDVGAGTGILSFLAVAAGAAKVYAVEPTPVADVARRIAADNGWGEKVKVINSRMEDAELDEKVDLIVFEWLGAMGNDENMYGIFLDARDRWLKPGGKMVPEHVTAWMCPAEDGELAAEREFWLGNPYGVEMGSVWREFRDEFRYGSNHIREANLLSKPQALWSFDSYADASARAGLEYEAAASFKATREGGVDGLAAWFSCRLFGGVRLDNSPSSPSNHWGRLVLPLERTRFVKKGDGMEARMTARPGGLGYCTGGYSFRLEGGEWERHLDHRGREPGSPDVFELVKGKGDVCGEILRSLPEWFGIESAVKRYVSDAESLPMLAARAEGKIAGFLSIRPHNRWTAEINSMAVRREFHRRGIGRGLVRAAEEYLRTRGYRCLSVKTLSESRPCEEYDGTRKFYAAMGFLPVEEFPALWGPDNPCLLLVKPI